MEGQLCYKHNDSMLKVQMKTVLLTRLKHKKKMSTAEWDNGLSSKDIRLNCVSSSFVHFTELHSPFPRHRHASYHKLGHKSWSRTPVFSLFFFGIHGYEKQPASSLSYFSYCPNYYYNHRELCKPHSSQLLHLLVLFASLAT